MWWKQLKRKENIETANNEVFRCLCIVFHLLNLSPFPFLCDLPVGDSFLTLWKCLERHFPECLLYWWKLEAQVIWKLTVFLRYCSLPIFYMWFQRSLYIYIWTMYALVTTIQNFSYTSKFCDWFFFSVALKIEVLHAWCLIMYMSGFYCSLCGYGTNCTHWSWRVICHIKSYTFSILFWIFVIVFMFLMKFFIFSILFLMEFGR